MIQFVVTREIMQNAVDYIPLAQKDAFVEKCAEICVQRVSVQTEEGKDAGYPPMYRVNMNAKSRCLMAALVGMYLGQVLEVEVDKNGDGWAVSADEYDRLAGSHVFNQIQRWKSDKEMANKAFNILYDYYDLEKRINAEISSRLSLANDSVVRISDLSRIATAEMPKLMASLEALRQQAGGDSGA